MLSFDLLQSLWDRLGSIGAPVVTAAAPGLSEADIREALAPEGLEPGAEVLVWWQWRNGTLSGICRAESCPHRWICPERNLIPLEEALLRRRINMDVADATSEADRSRDKNYDPRWLPILAYSSAQTVVTCDSDPSPVRHYDIENLGRDGCQVVRAPSIGTMVQRWIDAIDARLWNYDSETDLIERDWDAMPQEWRLSGFM